MNKNEFRFIEIIQGSVTNRGNIQELPEDITNLDLDYYGKEVTNGFNSVFMHARSFKEYYESFNSIFGYTGPVYCEFLYWDMDASSIQQAKKETEELVERLLAYSKNIRIYFSGNKGFHIIMYCPELEEFIDKQNFNEFIKNTCLYLAKDLGTFDQKVYDKTRIFRTPNSKHGLTNLYKIELTYNELKQLSIQEIKDLAKKQRKLNQSFVLEKNNDITKLIIEANDKQQTTSKQGMFNASELLNGIVYGFSEGERNSAFASIAGMLHARNIDKDFIKAILYNINNNNETKLSEREIDHVVNSISKYKVDEKYIDASVKDIYTFKDAGEAWLKNMNLSGNFSLGDRYKDINEVMSITLLGDLIGIVANSGVGKSTLALDFGNTYANIKNKYTLFVSLEMAKHACFFRGATITFTPDELGNVSSKEVAYQLIHNNEIRDAVYKEWNRTLIVDKGSISLNQIEDYANISNEYCHGLLGAMVIDYCQYIEGASEIDKSIMIYRTIKDVLKRLNIIGFMAIQCNKLMPNSYTEIEDIHLEGVKAIKQACDYVMAFWKSRKDEYRLHGKFLKTRWEKDNMKFDLKRKGLLYHTEEILKEGNEL